MTDSNSASIGEISLVDPVDSCSEANCGLKGLNHHSLACARTHNTQREWGEKKENPFDDSYFFLLTLSFLAHVHNVSSRPAQIWLAEVHINPHHMEQLNKNCRCVKKLRG